jgi:hypothetical protein
MTAEQELNRIENKREGFNYTFKEMVWFAEYYAKKQAEAINYTRCCEELKAECECNKGKNGEGMDLVRDFNKAFRSL